MKTCSRCGSKNLVKKGFTPAGKQKYKCKDCNYHSTMIQKVVYDIASEEQNIKPIIQLTKEEAKVVFIYKFRFGVSEEDIANHLNKPIEIINDYVKFLKEEQERTKKLIDFEYKEKQLKHWLGIK